MESTGLYLHFPFCKRRCVYCDFAVVVGRDDRMDGYVEALIAELRHLSQRTGGPSLETIYVGGGTPTRSPLGVTHVLDAVRDFFPVCPDAEITVEANPESATTEVLDRLAGAGVNRLSLGVQSFNDERLARLGRLHNAGEARAAVRRARPRFPVLSLDLIFGLPGVPVEAWQDDLEAAVALEPDHLSAYCLTVEDGTPLAEAIGRGRAAPPDNDLEAAHLARTAAFLPARGYERYEISNFARPGRRCRHNLRYWEHRTCLGAGLGAAGFWQGVRWKNTTGFCAYLDQAGRDPEAAFPPGPAAETSEELPPPAALGESILVGLRLLEGVDLERLGARSGLDAEAVFGETISDLVDARLLRRRDHRIALTGRGLRFANRVLAAFARSE